MAARNALALAVVAAGGPLLAAQEPAAPAAGAPPAAAPAPPPWVRGSLHSRYWLRWTGDDSDHDLYETLTLEFGDAERDAITGYFMGRGAWDIDGSEPAASPFFSLADSRGGDVTGYVYDAYVDFHRLSGLGLARVGRQPIHETPEFAFFDGLRLESSRLGDVQAQVGAYGGVSAHLYESWRSGDWTAGMYGQARPWTGGRVRLDWMHLEDAGRLGDHQDDLYALGLWQQLGKGLRLEGQYSRIEGRDRDVRARAAWNAAASDLAITATYYQLLRTQRSLVLELDPFYNALREYRPFWQTTLAATKGIGAHVDLTLGTDVRRVSETADIGVFNRDYERYWLTAGTSDLLHEGLRLEVTGELWRSDGQDVDSWGLEVGQELAQRRWRLSAGTYYSLYKYDLFLNRESDDVRTWFLRARHEVSAAVSASVTFELEDNDLDRFYFLRAEATWRF